MHERGQAKNDRQSSVLFEMDFHVCSWLGFGRESELRRRAAFIIRTATIACQPREFYDELTGGEIFMTGGDLFENNILRDIFCPTRTICAIIITSKRSAFFRFKACCQFSL